MCRFIVFLTYCNYDEKFFGYVWNIPKNSITGSFMTIQNDVSSDDRKFYFQLSLFEIKTSIFKHCFSSAYGRRLYFKEFYAVIFFTNIEF